MVPIAEHITGPGCIAEGLEHNEKLGGKGVHVIPAKHMYPFHWLMNDPEAGGTEGEDRPPLIAACLRNCSAPCACSKVGTAGGLGCGCSS